MRTICSNYTKFPLFTFCFIILFDLTIAKPILAHSFFYKQTKSNINLEDNEALQREWLETQPRFIRHDIHVSDKTIIPELLKYFNISVSVSYYDPGYNQSGFNRINYWRFKSPPNGLLCCYFKERVNPFKIEYPHADDKYTLDDLLQQEIAIEEAFVFWDASVRTQTIEPEIHLIGRNVYADDNKEEIINDYLISNKIIFQPKIIKPYCYNATHNTGMVVPLPTTIFDAIYFDAGIRLLPSTTTFETPIVQNCKKHSNGAKNIYFFKFNEIPRLKETKVIELPDNPNPYTAIRTWKRENNLYSYPPLTKEDDFITEKKMSSTGGFSYTRVSQQFETENVIYKVVCDDFEYVKRLVKEYRVNLEKWKNQCYFKPGEYYNHLLLPNRFGKSSKWIYDEFGNKYWYQYNVGWLFDDWAVDADDFQRGTVVARSSYFKSNRYYDNTEPPKKPKELV